MPFIRPTLASNDDIFVTCGPLVYTIEVESRGPRPDRGEPLLAYDEAIVVEMKSDTVYESADVIVETDD